MELAGEVALITGSGIRLGRAIALALAEKGCHLALHYNRSAEDAQEVALLARQAGVRADLFGADLSNPEAVETLSQQVQASFGHYDILINNAAVYLKGSGLDTSAEMLERQFRLNLFAPILLIRAFARQLPQDLMGKVVNISDAKTFRHQTDHFAYRLTKHAINEMTRMYALELAPRITVNAVAPGIMLPLAGFEHVDMQALGEKRVPLQRVGSPQIIAENVLHILAQDFMTGAILQVDGGENL